MSGYKAVSSVIWLLVGRGLELVPPGELGLYNKRNSNTDIPTETIQSCL